MFKTDDVIIYIAGAGSGKTTALMTDLQGLLKTYRPDEIAFTTFTRKGVSTGIERVLQTGKGLQEEDLPFFQTLHKMCFKEAGLTKDNIIEPRDMLRFGELLGFNVHLNTTFDRQTEDDKMLQRYDSIRSGAKKGIYLEAKYDEERYHRLVTSYEKFKKENKLVDFYDCLQLYMDVGEPLPVSAFFLDEAQDVTPLQWKVIEKAASNATKVRVSGDPSQAIFSYQGADPSVLISLSEKYKTIELNKTYRLPRKVCAVADSIIYLMQEKLPRVHEPAKEYEGVVEEIVDRELLSRMIQKDFQDKASAPYRWFLLFRNNHHTKTMTEALERLLLPYHSARGFVIGERDLNKISRYYRYRMQGYGDEEVKEKFRIENGIKDFNDSFTESALIPSTRRYVYEDYIEKYGLEELVKMARAKPFCLVSTTYKVKGGEADNVVVFLDATKQVAENLLVDLDSELRVFYVACTRAKEALYIAHAKSVNNLELIWEAVKEETWELLKA